MKRVDSWLCPDLLSGPGNYQRRGREMLEAAAPYIKRKGIVIQAGGHVGTVPVLLADIYSWVYTWEPELDNFHALAVNSAERGNARIYPARGCLGSKAATVALDISRRSTGQHAVSRAPGPIPVYRIDDMAVGRVDAIMLDVEGYEIPALIGAARTINRDHPMVIAEENKRAIAQGFKIGDLDVHMNREGYKMVRTVGEDRIYVHRGDL